MGYKYKKTFSKSAKREFAEKMKEIEAFCDKNGIQRSKNNDSYYFSINGLEYRVSNHTVEKSNQGAYDTFGIKTRELYHPEGRLNSITYIHAGKLRIIEIYNNLKAGYKLDGRGNRLDKEI